MPKTYVPAFLRSVHELSVYLTKHHRRMVTAANLSVEQEDALQALATALYDVQRLLGPLPPTRSVPTQQRRDERVYRPDPQAMYAQQGGRCYYCGVPLTLNRSEHRAGVEGPKRAEVDHTQPLSRGGGDEPGNYRLVCVDCNQHKGMLTGEEFSAALDARIRSAATGYTSPHTR